MQRSRCDFWAKCGRQSFRGMSEQGRLRLMARRVWPVIACRAGGVVDDDSQRSLARKRILHENVATVLVVAEAHGHCTANEPATIILDEASSTARTCWRRCRKLCRLQRIFARSITRLRIGGRGGDLPGGSGQLPGLSSSRGALGAHFLPRRENLSVLADEEGIPTDKVLKVAAALCE